MRFVLKVNNLHNFNKKNVETFFFIVNNISEKESLIEDDVKLNKTKDCQKKIEIFNKKSA